MIRSIRILFLVFTLFVSALGFAVPIEAEAGKVVKWEADIQSDELFVVPFAEDRKASVSVSDVAFGEMDGKQVAFIPSKGSGNFPGYFNVIDIKTGENLFAKTMEGATQIWSILTVGNDVYIGTTGKSAALWRFNTIDQSLVRLKHGLVGIATMFTLSTDGEKIFGGGFPEGRVFEYDIASGEFSDLGVADTGVREAGIADLEKPEEYIRSSAIYKDTLFVGTGSVNGRVMYRNIHDHDDSWHLLAMPTDGIFEEDAKKMAFIYDLNIVDDHLYVFSNAKNRVYIYDLINEQWLDTRIDDVRGQVGVSNKFNDKIYYSNRETKQLGVFDLETMSVQDPVMSFDSNLRTTEIINVDGEDRFYTVDFNGTLKYFVLENDQLVLKSQETEAEGQPAAIQSVHYDRDHDMLFASGYMGSVGYRGTVGKNVHETFPLGQIENMDSANGKIVFGEYPAGRMFTMDVATDTLNPEFKFALKDQGQDRPYRVVIKDDVAYIGTIADYGSLQGALTIYDMKTESVKTYTDLVENQSVVGIEVVGDYLYGSTTIHGGLGSEAVAGTQAQVFKFNLKTEEVELVRSLDELKQNVPMISGLHMNKQGQLLGFANGTIFELNPDNLEVVRKEVLYHDKVSFGKWRPVQFTYHKDVLYANPGFNITAIDPDSFTHAFIEESDKFAVTNEGKIIYAKEIELREIDFTINEIEEDVIEYEITPITVPNADFALDDGTGKPQDWTPYFVSDHPEVDYSLSDEYVKTGDKSLKVYDKNGSASMFVKSAKIPVEANELYEVSTELYLVNGRASAMMRFYDVNGKQINKDVVGKTLVHVDGIHHEWVPVTLSEYAPEGASYMHIVLGTNNAYQTNGAFYDHVNLVHKKPIGPDTEMAVTVPNYSFEEAIEVEGVLKPKAWTSLLNHEAQSENVYFYQSDEQKTDGEKSLYVYDKDSQHSMFVTSDPIPVVGNDTYVLEVDAYYKPQTLSTRRSQYLIRFYDEHDKMLSEKVETYPAAGNTNKWNTLKLGEKAPANARTLRIVLGANNASATDGIFYDNVRLTRITKQPEVDPLPPKQEVELRDALLNPSFEMLDAYGRAIGWTSLLNHEAVSENVYFYPTDEMSYDGESSLYLYDKDNSKSMYVASDPVKVEPGKTYRSQIQVNMKAINGSSRQFNFMIRFYDEAGKQIGKDILDDNFKVYASKDLLEDWHELEVMTTAPDTAVSLRVIFGTGNGGSNQEGTYVDAVNLQINVKEQIVKAITEAEAHDLSPYSIESVAQYQTRLKAVKEAAALDFIGDQEGQDILAQLDQALSSLQTVDYSALEQILLEITAIDLQQMSLESSQSLEVLLPFAQSYLATEHKSQVNIDQMVKSLETAKESLVPVDYSQLEAAIKTVDEIDENFYHAYSIKGLKLRIEKANLLIEQQERSQKVIDDMTIDILQYTLTALEKLDISELEALVTYTEKLELNQYTEASVANFKAAYIEALEVLENPQQDQDLVDQAIEKLQNALAQLEEKEEPEEPETPTEPLDPKEQKRQEKERRKQEKAQAKLEKKQAKEQKKLDKQIEKERKKVEKEKKKAEKKKEKEEKNKK